MAEIPSDFCLGLVLGKSGKAREALLKERFGYDGVRDGVKWKKDEAVVSGIAALETGGKDEERATRACRRLGACGLSSVPSWLRPYECLSNGEAARVDVAAALALHEADDDEGSFCVIDDFACVVNRDAARSMSCAVGKYCRRGGFARVVLVTAHRDVCAYLQPDWVLDAASGAFFTRPTAAPAKPKIVFECDWNDIPKIPQKERKKICDEKLWQELKTTYDFKDGDMKKVILGDGRLPEQRTSRVKVTPAVKAASIAFDFEFDGVSRFTPADFVFGALPEAWALGVVHGPSGSGKTTVLRTVFAGCAEGKVANVRPRWLGSNAKTLRSLFWDEFGPEDGAARVAVAVLTADEVDAVPADLSTCALARAAVAWNLRTGCVLDEFTSLAPRDVAAAVARNVSRYVRDNKLSGVVCATVHEDVIGPLGGDWLFATAVCTSCWARDPKKGTTAPLSPNGETRNGCLVLLNAAKTTVSRTKTKESQTSFAAPPATETPTCAQLFGAPEIPLQLTRCPYYRFDSFKKHHYLTEAISGSARCFEVCWNGKPIAFHSVLSAYGLPGAGAGSTGAMREHRVVVLPDYQGIGLGWMMSEIVASYHIKLGTRFMSITMHPTFGGMRDVSARWRPKPRNHQSDKHEATYNAEARKEADWSPKDRDRMRPSFRHEYVGGDGDERDNFLRVVSDVVPVHKCKGAKGCSHCTTNRREVDKILALERLSVHELAGTAWIEGGPEPVNTPLPRVVEVASRAEKGRSNVASTWVFSKRLSRDKHPRFEFAPRDDRSSKNEPNRVENDRDMRV